MLGGRIGKEYIDTSIPEEPAVEEDKRGNLGGCSFEEEDNNTFLPERKKENRANDSDTGVQNMTPKSGPPTEEEQSPPGPNAETEN